MPRFAANLSLLFTELPFFQRFGAARAAGFQGVEFLFPYDHDARDIRAALDDCGLPLVLFNTPAGDWAAGERGHGAVVGVDFRGGLERALDYAAALEPKFIHLMAGIADGTAARACFVENLHWATKFAPDQTFLIEPINRYDMQGYFLHDFAQAKAVLAEVNIPNLALQFDAYHAHRMTGDVARCWAAFGPLARHIQIAGAPGRHEPIPSEIDYNGFFRRLDDEGYTGFVSGEYVPAKNTKAGLGWLEIS
jgi:2-dehydrotetronate isomerase